MARPLRLVVPDALHHVIARGNERRPVFRDDDDRRLYLTRLAHYRERDGFRLIAFCLMDNHVHLALETGAVGLPKTMAGLHSSYTQAFNRKYARVGHLFQGRYKSVLVDRESYGQALIRYIHRNPVEAGIVRRDVDYQWSSARAWFQGSGPDWLDLNVGLRIFGQSPKRALTTYRTFRSDANGDDYEEIPTLRQQVKGDDAFAEEIRKRADDGMPRRRKISLENLAREVAREEGLTVSALRLPGKGRRETAVRAKIALLALEECGIPVAKTARLFERDGSSLIRAVARYRAEEGK